VKKIKEAEGTLSQKVMKDTVNQEERKDEYESLVLGQSIWSTDMPRQSRQQFIRNIT
jgi:hypothetical protein